MNGTLERSKENGLEQLVRQPWMDTPLKDMTQAQRLQLKEFEKQVKEMQEAADTARRIAEGERRSLEIDILAAVASFHMTLHQLHIDRLAADMLLAVVQQQQFALSSSVHEVRGLPRVPSSSQTKCTEALGCHQRSDCFMLHCW